MMTTFQHETVTSALDACVGSLTLALNGAREAPRVFQVSPTISHKFHAHIILV